MTIDTLSRPALTDQSARDQAIDPTHSFIVQAPAGSGKTALLIQRLLSLLSIVDKPEEIIAITFTKKAANEMLERLLDALNQAQTNTACDNAFAQKTQTLAKKVLARDADKHWQLLSNPARLNILTIDALNVRLNRQLPISSGLGIAPTICDNPSVFYQQAIHQLFQGLEQQASWSGALTQVLLHCDNRYDVVERLLIKLLEKRDQWLGHVFNKTQMQRDHLENALTRINKDVLKTLSKQFSIGDKTLLLECLHFAKSQLPETPLFQNCTTSPLTEDLNSKASWLAVCELLFTKKDTWREKLDKRSGFPANCDDKALKAQSKALKTALLDWIAQHKTDQHLQTLLIECRYLPPCDYTETQWQLIEALLSLLPIAVAQLTLLFAEHQQIDYIENALAALQGLGDEEQVSDLALALDYRLKHLLIDEFQDTSISQLRLIEKLTQTWQPNEGRSLFIVGDPMQSIYRFREADVSIFLQVCESGLAHFPVTFLQLRSNFRSQQPIIDWVNRTFSQAFPNQHDKNTGAIAFAPSEAVKTESAAVQCLNTDNSGDTVVQIIQTALSKNPKQSIAVLVRAKTHLADIIPALKQANIPYQAVEIEQLSHRPIIFDLMALTKALCYLSDRTAWLSVLKAPFCGLSLADLTLLSQNANITIYEALQTVTLSDDGQQRVAFILPILQTQLMQRQRTRLSNWIYDTWLLLQAPQYYRHHNDHQDSLAYFQLLTQTERNARLDNWHAFEKSVSTLFANAEQGDAPVTLMTMHKSKGLEFDTVILPELHRKPNTPDNPLLLWQERLLENDCSDLLLAPIKASDELASPLYQYLKQLQQLKLRYEAVRLFYVACTRAKSHLFLCAHCDQNSTGELKHPDGQSLLASIWPAVQTEFTTTTTEPTSNTNNTVSVNPKRFTLAAFQKAPKLNVDTTQQTDTDYNWQAADAKHIGTLTHRLLQWIAERGIQWWETLDKSSFIALQAKLQGLSHSAIKAHSQTILSIIDKTLADKSGHWILQAHPTHHCEFELTGIIENELKHIIIDRWFIDQTGQAWVIDYKILLEENANLKAAAKTYQAQLKCYQTLLSNHLKQPVQTALYFPVQSVLIEIN